MRQRSKMKGLRVREDEIVRGYELAAEQGYARAQCFLGFSYEHGHELEDKAEAARWYKLAAEHMHLVATWQSCIRKASV